MSRALRRHHIERLKVKRKVYYYWYVENVDNPQRLLGFYANTACVCSCYGCGNPRKWFNQKTLQELRFEIACNSADS